MKVLSFGVNKLVTFYHTVFNSRRRIIIGSFLSVTGIIIGIIIGGINISDRFFPPKKENTTTIQSKNSILLNGKINKIPYDKSNSNQDIPITIFNNNNKVVLTDEQGRFSLELPINSSPGKIVDLQIKLEEWKILNPFLGRLKLPNNINNNFINIQLVKITDDITDSELFLQQLTRYIQDRTARHFDINNISSLDTSSFYNDVADYYKVPNKLLAEKLPDFADHILNNRELYEDETIGAAFYAKRQYKKAAPAYANNAREKLTFHQNNIKEDVEEIVRAFIQSGDSYLSAQYPMEALNEYTEALKLTNQNSNLNLWIDVKSRQASAHAVMAIHTSKGEDIHRNLNSSLMIYHEIIPLISNNKQTELWASTNFKFAITQAASVLFSDSPNKAEVLEDGIRNLRQIIKTNKKLGFNFDLAVSQQKLGFLLNLKYIVEKTQNKTLLYEARENFNEALIFFTEDKYPGLRAETIDFLITNKGFINPDIKITDRQISKNIELLNIEIKQNKTDNNLFLLYSNQRSIAKYYQLRAETKKDEGKSYDYDLAIEKYKSILLNLSAKNSGLIWAQNKLELADIYYHKAGVATKDQKIYFLNKSVNEYQDIYSENLITKEYSNLFFDRFAVSLYTLGDLLGGDEGIRKIEKAISILKNEQNYKSTIFESTEVYLGDAYWKLSRHTKDNKKNIEYLTEAFNVYKSVLSKSEYPNDWIILNRFIGEILLQKTLLSNVEDGAILIDEVVEHLSLVLKSNKFKSVPLVEKTAIYTGLGDSYLYKASNTLADAKINSNKAIGFYELALKNSLEMGDVKLQIDIKNQIAQCFFISDQNDTNQINLKNINEGINLLKSTLQTSNILNYRLISAKLNKNIAIGYRKKLVLIENNAIKLTTIDLILKYFEASLEFFTKDSYPDKWSRMILDSSIVLIDKANIIDDETQKEILEKALDLNKSALKVIDFSSNKIEWLEAHERIGNIYKGLSYFSENEIKEENLKKSILHYHVVLDVDRKESKDLEFAGVKAAEGESYFLLGQIGYDKKYSEYLKNSISSYKQSIVTSQIKSPSVKAERLIALAQSQNQLRFNFSVSQQEKTILTNDALKNYELALEVFTKKDNFLEWANIKWSIGNLLSNFSTKKDNSIKYKQAVDAYELALEFYTRDTHPDSWIVLQKDIALTYKNSLSNVERNIRLKNLETALDIYNEIALVLKVKDKIQWAQLYQNDIASLYEHAALISDGSVKINYYLQTIEAYKKALTVLSNKDQSYDFHFTNNGIGDSYLEIYKYSKNTNDKKHILDAIKYYRISLQEFSKDKDYLDWTFGQIKLVNAYKIYAERTKENQGHINKAIELSEELLAVYSKEDFPGSWSSTVADIANLINMRDGFKKAIQYFSSKQNLLTSDKTKAMLYREEAKFLESEGKKEAAEKARTNADMLYAEDEDCDC